VTGDAVVIVDRASEAFHRALLENDPESAYEQAPCGYLSTTPEGVIVKVNQTFLAMTGHLREELVGRRSFAELLAPGGRIYFETHYRPLLLMHGAVREVALDIVRPDGDRVPVLVNATAELDEGGSPVVVRVAVFDATERRSYERELLRAKEQAEASEARAAALASTLQRTLIPPTPPVVPGLEVEAAYRPAGDGHEVGGDFYDVFQVSPDEWVAVLGDVSGKGTDAAVVTALVRHSLRGISMRTATPSESLHALNEVVLRHPTERFCTVVVVRLARREGGWDLTVSCGGHAPPLLLRTGHPPVPVGEPGSLIGVFADSDHTDTSMRLSLGDVMVMFTDGVTEGRRGTEQFGDERVLASLSAHSGSVQDAVATLLDDVLEFQGQVARDDIALLAISPDAS